MYGGPGKLGRGGGGAGGGGRGAGGAVKRNVNSTFHPSPLPRPSPTPGGRLSSAGPRNSSTAPGPTTSSSAAEENFSLVTGNPLNFAMIIRLTPDLVDEIKRAESQGCTTRIRFDANANNTSGNVIDVGGKDFRFTWSREMGDLCDIYEERRSGEDGNGLLVESGCAWRKLNVQRVLDESTKNHVKMRSEEAERKFKSRKAIVLEHGNPSMKSQVKALAAAEVNPWTRMPFKQKKEPQPPFKKRKAEPPPVGGPPKSVHKSGFSSTTPSKGRTSASPLPSTPEQSGAPASPFGTGKSHAIVEDVMPAQAMSKEITTRSEKEVPNRVITSAVRDKPGRKGNLGAQPTDLRSLLISLLMENPKGMSLKALEKATGDSIPNSTRQIEPIIKKIAMFQAPGRYILKPGVELESFKKPSSESGSSPEDNRHQTLTADGNADQVPVPEPIISVKAHRKELDEQTQLNSKPGEVSNALEKNDIPHHSPDLLGETKVTNNSEGPAGSSSDSGSDSDSDGDSSDSGSDSGSHSRSKSRSPVRSGSGSSSDSESDASSNSKEASDEDVDIMTSDDDKESKNKLQASELGLFTSPIPWRTDGGPVQNGIDEKRDGLGSDIVEIVEDLFGNDQEAEMTVVTNSDPNKKGEKPAEETKPPSSDHQESLFYAGNLDSERENMANDGYKHVQSDTFERKSKGKSKRGSDGKHFDDNSERTKRLKSGNLTQPQMSGGRNSHLSLSPHNLSPRSIEGPHKGPTIRTTNTAVSDETDFGLLKGYNQLIPGKSVSDSQPSGRRSIDLSALPKPPAAVERPVKYGDVKYSERNLQTHEVFPTQKDKVNRETQGDDGYTNEQKHPKNSKEGGVGDKHSTPVDSHYRKHGELAGKFKEVGSLLNSHMEYPVINGRGSILKRELSDLELGELREPIPDETPGVKKQFERKSSFKQLENRPTSSDYWNSDLRKGKPAGKISVDIIKQSLPNSSIGIPSNLEGLSKKRTPEHNVEELARPNHRVVQSQPQQLLRVDDTEAGPQFNKLADANCKSRLNEAGERLGIGLEGYGDAHKKVSVSAEQQQQQQHGNKRGLVPNSIKESKKQKSNTLIDSSNKQNDTLTERDDGRQKRRESSSDENNCSYYKYEKEEPELKGPIKDFSQYKEYVQEYREKYDSYCSLNKILESYRNDFNKLGRDLEIAKGKDMDRYHNLMGQLKESYRQCGTKHKRLKKIFVVLHEELKCLKEMIKDYAVPYKKE